MKTWSRKAGMPFLMEPVADYIFDLYCKRFHLIIFATADPRTHFVSCSLQYPDIFSTSKPLSLFQLLLSLILCASAAIFPALCLCESLWWTLSCSTQFGGDRPRPLTTLACCSQPEWEVEEDLQCVTASFPCLSSRLPSTGITCPHS